MDERQDVDIVTPDLVDQPVATEDEFADSRVIELRHGSSSLSHLRERASGVPDSTDKRRRVGRRVLGDVVGDAFEVAPCGLGPGYSSSQR